MSATDMEHEEKEVRGGIEMKTDMKASFYYKSSSGISKTRMMLILLLSLVCMCIMMAILLVRSQSQRNTPSTLSNLCLPCHDLQTTLYSDDSSRPLFDTLRVKHDSGVKMCCADDDVQVSAMFELVAKKQQSLAYNRGPLSALKSFEFFDVYTHKLLKCNPDYTQRTQGQKPRFGRPGYPITLAIKPTYTDIRYELSQGVELLPTGIKIIHPALYYVYHSVNFMTDDDHPCRTFASQTFMSLLVRNSTTSGQCKVLLRSEHTCCPDCKSNKESAFTAGQFYLNTGDVLQAEVSSVDLLKFDEHSTYLGLIMMGGGGNVYEEKGI